MNYTPGPWTIEEYQKLGADGERRPATYIEATKGWAKGKRTIAIIGHWRDRPNPKEDARLIAAAPELLEELEVAEQTLRNLGNGELVGDARIIALNAAANSLQVIRKAKGE